LARSRLTQNRVRPTERQIKSNLIVVPKVFCDEHPEIDWKNFAVSAFGGRISWRSLDGDRRLGLPLREKLPPGHVLTLSIADDRVLMIDIE
jgi:hypothetical protein